MRKLFSSPVVLILSMALGISMGFTNAEVFLPTAKVLSEIFMDLFKTISVPIVFLSLASAISGLAGIKKAQQMGSRVFLLSLFTTFLSSLVALAVYVTIRPTALISTNSENASTSSLGVETYFASLRKIIPHNFLSPFVEGNTLSVVLIAISMGLAALTLPEQQRKTIHSFFDSFLALFMKFVGGINRLLPLGVWGFAYLFAVELKDGSSMRSLFLYICCIVAANAIQATLVLPLLLKRAKIPVLSSLRGMWPALSLAFFSKSSCAAMPLAIGCAENNLRVQKHVSRFTFPLCTSVNMNACAGFILITFLFVAESHGVQFSTASLIQWTFLSTIIAMGHAGVPMGCYFLASALVVQANLPLTLMGIILPFYSLLDMFESAINLWSDSCIALIVDKSDAQSSIT